MCACMWRGVAECFKLSVSDPVCAHARCVCVCVCVRVCVCVCVCVCEGATVLYTETGSPIHKETLNRSFGLKFWNFLKP